MLNFDCKVMYSAQKLFLAWYLHDRLCFLIGLNRTAQVLSLNPIFLAPLGQQWKISVPIRKRRSWGFQKSPYFCSYGHFWGSYGLSKHGKLFFGTPCRASVLARASLMIMNGAQPSLLSSTGQGPGVCVKVFSSDWSTTSKTVLLLENMYTLWSHYWRLLAVQRLMSEDLGGQWGKVRLIWESTRAAVAGAGCRSPAIMTTAYHHV